MTSPSTTHARPAGRPARSPLAPQTVPEAIGALALAGAVYLAASPDRLEVGGGSRCLLRNRLGLACPLCGGTTAIVDLVHGHPIAAVAANPMVALLAPVALVLAVVLVARRLGVVRTATRWSPAARALVATAAGGALLANWAWELHRLA
jgi:hypothetical protein